jgi:hypothetical protein
VATLEGLSFTFTFNATAEKAGSTIKSATKTMAILRISSHSNPMGPGPSTFIPSPFKGQYDVRESCSSLIYIPNGRYDDI